MNLHNWSYRTNRKVILNNLEYGRVHTHTGLTLNQLENKVFFSEHNNNAHRDQHLFYTVSRPKEEVHDFEWRDDKLVSLVFIVCPWSFRCFVVIFNRILHTKQARVKERNFVQSLIFMDSEWNVYKYKLLKTSKS